MESDHWSISICSVWLDYKISRRVFPLLLLLERSLLLISSGLCLELSSMTQKHSGDRELKRISAASVLEAFLKEASNLPFCT